jgi:hypothetical protein
MKVRLLSKRLSVCIVAILLSTIGPSIASAGGVAKAARHVSVNESVNTHLLQHHRTKLSETGSGSGTFSCGIALNLNLYSTSASIAFTCSPHGGSFSGSGNVSVHYIGTIAEFKGTLGVSQGNGSYSHARASGLRITGTIKTNSYAIKAQVTGSMTM